MGAHLTAAEFTEQRRIGENVLIEVALWSRVLPEAIKGEGRTQRVAFARQIVCYVLRETTALSFPAIGRFIQRDHSTVIVAYNRIKARTKAEPAFGASLLKLVDALRAKRPACTCTCHGFGE